MKVMFLVLYFVAAFFVIDSANAEGECRASYNKFAKGYRAYVTQWNNISFFLKQTKNSDEINERFIKTQKNGAELLSKGSFLDKNCRIFFANQEMPKEMSQTIKMLKIKFGCVLFEERNIQLINEVADSGQVTEADKEKARSILSIYLKNKKAFSEQCNFYYTEYSSTVEEIKTQLNNIIAH